MPWSRTILPDNVQDNFDKIKKKATKESKHSWVTVNLELLSWDTPCRQSTNRLSLSSTLNQTTLDSSKTRRTELWPSSYLSWRQFPRCGDRWGSEASPYQETKPYNQQLLSRPSHRDANLKKKKKRGPPFACTLERACELLLRLRTVGRRWRAGKERQFRGKHCRLVFVLQDV